MDDYYDNYETDYDEEIFGEEKGNLLGHFVQEDSKPKFMNTSMSPKFMNTNMSPKFMNTNIFGCKTFKENIREALRYQIMPFLNIEAVYFFFKTVLDKENIHDFWLNKYYNEMLSGNFKTTMEVVSESLGISWNGTWGPPDNAKISQYLSKQM